jgi:hypothetical protein
MGAHPVGTTRLLILLVAIDLIAKIAAFAFLPEAAPIDREASFQLVLSVNTSGLGTKARELMRDDTVHGFAATSMAFLALGLALVAVRGRPWGTWRKISFCAGAFGLWVVIGALLEPQFARLPDAASLAIIRGALTLFTLAVWVVVPRGLWKLALTLAAAGAVGNLLSSVYPPFHVVDFMYSALANRVLGLGVFNFADLCIEAGRVCLVIALLDSIVRWLRRRFGAAQQTS